MLSSTGEFERSCSGLLTHTTRISLIQEVEENEIAKSSSTHWMHLAKNHISVMGINPELSTSEAVKENTSYLCGLLLLHRVVVLLEAEGVSLCRKKNKYFTISSFENLTFFGFTLIFAFGNKKE